jgi:hypothetical protein
VSTETTTTATATPAQLAVLAEAERHEAAEAVARAEGDHMRAAGLLTAAVSARRDAAHPETAAERVVLAKAAERYRRYGCTEIGHENGRGDVCEGCGRRTERSDRVRYREAAKNSADTAERHAALAEVLADPARRRIAAELAGQAGQAAAEYAEASGADSVAECAAWNAAQYAARARRAAAEVPVPTEQWTPSFSSWRHGGWYVDNLRRAGGGCGCVSRNYPDRKWRIVCDPRNGSYPGGPNDHTYPSRVAAARAERELVAAGFC